MKNRKISGEGEIGDWRGGKKKWLVETEFKISNSNQAKWKFQLIKTPNEPKISIYVVIANSY
jgi:hypothetical protein